MEGYVDSVVQAPEMELSLQLVLEQVRARAHVRGGGCAVC